MELRSPAFEHEGTIPSKHTCDGENTNPPLELSGVPAGTGSLVLIMDDPDVPKNLKEDGMWDHWVLFNLSPELREIREGEEPEGTHGQGTGGNTDYYGPCPPDREHRYSFRLYALDGTLDLPEKSAKLDVESAMSGHVIDTAVLMGRYERT